jgi:hypothetical protein
MSREGAELADRTVAVADEIDTVSPLRRLAPQLDVETDVVSDPPVDRARAVPRLHADTVRTKSHIPAARNPRYAGTRVDGGSAVRVTS